MSKTTEAIMQAASSYSDVVEGQSCSQTSFKRKNKAFLYIGEQGGRHKAMFKLSQSMRHNGLQIYILKIFRSAAADGSRRASRMTNQSKRASGKSGSMKAIRCVRDSLGKSDPEPQLFTTWTLRRTNQRLAFTRSIAPAAGESGFSEAQKSVRSDSSRLPPYCIPISVSKSQIGCSSEDLCD